VSRIKKVTATCRAAANILVTRARGETEATTPFVFGEAEGKLRKENRELRSEVEELRKLLEERKAPDSSSRTVVSRPTKRSRITDISDEEGALQPTSSDIVSEEVFPPLTSPSAGRQRERTKAAVPTVPALAPTPTVNHCIDGLTLKGNLRRIDPYPTGLLPECRAQCDALLEKIGKIQAKLTSLTRGEGPAPTPLPRKSAPATGEEVAFITSSLSHTSLRDKKVPPSVPPAAKAGGGEEGTFSSKKKKKGKSRGIRRPLLRGRSRLVGGREVQSPLGFPAGRRLPRKEGRPPFELRRETPSH